jgi:hypothetical protein
MWAPRWYRDWWGVWAAPGRLWCRLAHRGLWKVWTTTDTRGASRVFYRCRMCWRNQIITIAWLASRAWHPPQPPLQRKLPHRPACPLHHLP